MLAPPLGAGMEAWLHLQGVELAHRELETMLEVVRLVKVKLLLAAKIRSSNLLMVSIEGRLFVQ